MGDRVAGNPGGSVGDLRAVCMVVAGRPAGREHAWPGVWCDWVWIHVVRGGAGSAEACADVAGGSSQIVDARAFVAGAALIAADSASWRISLWRSADAGTDVAADHYGGQRS